METTEQTGVTTTILKRGEIASTAMAAKARAEIESRFAIALHRKRIVNDVRISILDSCKRPAFARGAMYSKPVGGGKTVDGFSIRFAEEAIKSMGNISVDCATIYEDDERRTIHISVTDLESNSTYGDEITLAKTVERRQLKDGQVAISERMNSTGQKVFVVQATEEDMQVKMNAAKSKVIRNSGLRLVPQDILEEAWDMIVQTQEKGGEDPKAETKKVCDAFSTLGIKPAELERFLKHSLESITPKEINQLRKMYTAIRDEEATWATYMAEAEPKKPVSMSPDEAAKAAATAIDATVIEKPYEHLVDLAKKDGVTEAQIHTFMKARKLAGDGTEELVQASDANMRTVISTWTAVLPHIKKIKA